MGPLATRTEVVISESVALFIAVIKQGSVMVMTKVEESNLVG